MDHPQLQIPSLRSSRLLALLVVSSTDEKIVLREPVNPPSDANSGFLRYFTASDKQITCGDCDVGHQAAWVRIAHAKASEDLVTSGEAQSYYRTSHAVSDRGRRIPCWMGSRVRSRVPPRAVREPPRAGQRAPHGIGRAAHREQPGLA